MDLVKEDEAPQGDPASDEAAEELTLERFTIDELSSASGVPSRTIRFYQSKGALHPPERVGRVAYYEPTHVDRLRLIATLQDRGLRLDAIRDLLHQLDEGGDSLHEWLGLGDRLQAPWTDERPIVLSQAELHARAREAGIDLDGDTRPGLIAELERKEVIERRSDAHPPSFVVPSPGLLDIALQLEAAGIDLDTAVGAQRILRSRLGKAADELVEFFADRAGRGFGRHREPADILESLDVLRPSGSEAVALIFAQEMERALRRFVERGGVVPTKRGERGKGRR